MTHDDAMGAGRSIAGASGDFVVVSHLVVSGSQTEMGFQLARAAAGAYRSAPRPIAPALGRARRRWFERNWPEQHERCHGMAAAFSVAEDDASLCVDDLNGFPIPGGCSAVWCPPKASAGSMVVRNFDIHVSMIDTDPVPHIGQRLPVLSRPHVVEMHPDKGQSSVVITGNNLSGCLEGINEAGLCVVELADGQGDTLRATNSPQAGLDESQLPRFLLDRCRTAEQAREALYEVKHYTRFSSCHFMVADAQGDAFIWEREGDNVEHVVDADAVPLVVTNHLLSQDADPAGEDDGGTRARRRSLLHQLGHGELATADVHAALDLVRAEATAIPHLGMPTAVTLWRTEYDLAAALMIVRFLLGFGESQRYSEPVSVGLL